MNKIQKVRWQEPELVTPRREVFPGKGQLSMRCGSCGHRNFRLHIVSEGTDFGRIDEAICLHCLVVYKVDNHGRLAGKQE